MCKIYLSEALLELINEAIESKDKEAVDCYEDANLCVVALVNEAFNIIYVRFYTWDRIHGDKIYSFAIPKEMVLEVEK